MPALIPFAVIHIGVSIALAAILILLHRRLHKADFLLYWAMFWLAIAVILAAVQVGFPLSGGTLLAPLLSAFGIALFPLFPVLMLCAGLSLGVQDSQRMPRRLLTACALISVTLGLIAFLRPALVAPLIPFRPILTSLAVAFFVYRLATRGERDAGPARPALIALSLIYSIHNLALGWQPPGLHIYPPGGYSPTAATVGILLQFGLTIVFAYSAIERAAQATREAREADSRLRSLLESVSVAGLILDREGHVEFCNNWLLQALERPIGDVVGSAWFESYVPPGVRYRVRQVFDTAIETGKWPAICEYPILAAENREVTVQWYHSALRDTDGSIIGAAALGLDLSQQRMVEAQIRQGQRLETLGRLASGVAHDFNNNLTIINRVADSLLPQFPPADPVHQCIKDIRHAGELASVLTRQLLTFGRQRQCAPRLVSLNDILLAIGPMLRRLIGEGVELEIETDPDCGYVLADPGQLDQIVINLVLNANDAILGHGNIHLSARTMVGRGPDRHQAQELVVLSVRDNGAGMSERTRGRIFEPFFTTKAPGKGTGLGLAMVHGAVSQAGGWIDVESQLSVGTVISVYLPRVAAPSCAPAAPVPHLHTQEPVTATVLLVDDHAALRRLAAEILSGEGYRVLEAANGVEALCLAADPSLEISLLITDVAMPRMSGPELAQRLEELRPGLPALFVSGHAFYEEEITSHTSRVRGFLQKPYTPEQICDQVARIIQLAAY